MDTPNDKVKPGLSKGLFIAACVVFALLIAGCDSQSNDDDDGEQPPLLLPAIFSVETDLFDPGSLKGGSSKLNFLTAVFRVWPVSIVLSSYMIIPVAVTAAALNDTPEFVNGAWEWTTTVPVEQSTMTFTLSGRPSGTTINWSMEISGSDPITGVNYSSFELFTAHTTVGDQSGSWKLYYEVEGVRTNVLNASFDIIDADSKFITYTVPIAIPGSGGDSILYDVDANSRQFFWQQFDPAEFHDIRWNSVTQEGSIVSTTFNNGAKGCWDTNQDDVPCP